ncbi:MAG: hypothetical protein AAB447_03895 [Patescibacteria group bacterium]
MLSLQIFPFHNALIKCVVHVHKWNGYADTVEINKDDAAFYARQKARLINEFGFTPTQAEKMIGYREKIADIFVDRWMEKSSHSLNEEEQ